MDLPWAYVPELRTEQDLRRVVFNKQPSLIYVYSPLCPYCVSGAPVFEEAVRTLPSKRAFRFNAMPSLEEADRVQDLFTKVTNVKITHFPMVLGITKKGLLVEYKGPVSAQVLADFYEALRQT